MPELNDVAVNLILGVLSFLGGLLIARTDKAGSRENKLIDQLQEENRAQREETSKLSGRVEELSRAFHAFQAREAMYEYHIQRQDLEIQNLGGVPLERPSLIQRETEGE